jgi:hypothetical protein
VNQVGLCHFHEDKISWLVPFHIYALASLDNNVQNTQPTSVNGAAPVSQGMATANTRVWGMTLSDNFTARLSDMYLYTQSAADRSPVDGYDYFFCTNATYLIPL